MSDFDIYLNIILMAAVTYLIRVIPLLFIKKPITNRFIKSFLYYAPYVTLSVMLFPGVLYATGNTFTAVCGAAFAFICSFMSDNYALASLGSIVAVFLAQLISR